jgi:hypothetical protein
VCGPIDGLHLSSVHVGVASLLGTNPPFCVHEEHGIWAPDISVVLMVCCIYLIINYVTPVFSFALITGVLVAACINLQHLDHSQINISHVNLLP